MWRGGPQFFLAYIIRCAITEHSIYCFILHTSIYIYTKYSVYTYFDTPHTDKRYIFLDVFQPEGLQSSSEIGGPDVPKH